MASRLSLNSAPAARPTALAFALAAVLVGGVPGTGIAGQARAAFIAPAAMGGAVSGLDDGTGLPPPAQAVQAPQTLYLDIVMDGRVVRPLVRFAFRDGRLFVYPEQLELAGLRLPEGLALDAQGRVALDAVPGLQAHYDQALQRVILTPAPQLRPTQRLGYSPPGPVDVRRDTGVALDWDVYARSLGDTRFASLGTRFRWFGRFGNFEQYGVSRAGNGRDGSDGYTRVTTAWHYSDPEDLWTVTAGDLVSGGLAWTRPVRMAGIQWRRNFGVRPDLVTYPLPQLSGDATVPSSVELYINNVRQFGKQVDPGPFVLNNFPRVIGAGQAVIVVTDALGRTTRTSVPLYVGYQRLAPGLSDFSVEAGVLRRSFGRDSGDYGDRPVASASWRRGLNHDVTVEVHGEAGPGLRQAGFGLAWSPLGRYGVVTGSLAQSRGDHDGHQYSAGYQWYGQRVGFDLYHQRASAGYRDLGSLRGGMPPLRAQDRASLWFGIPRGSLSLTWLRYRDHERPASRTVSLGLSHRFDSAVFSANAFNDSRSGNGVALSLYVPLGEDLSVSFGANRDGDDDTELSASIRRDTPYAGGWGWEATAQDDGDGQLSARWRTGRGEFWFGVDRIAGRTGGFAQGNGSIVMMDGQVFASERISDAFAVVSTQGFAGVPILYENRVAGQTNEHGYMLLPDLRGWQRNRIGIDPDGLPANVEVPRIERLLTPAASGGLRIAFELEPIRAAIVILHDVDGEPVLAGTRVRRADGSEAIVGFDGELWLERYVDGEALRWTRAGAGCSVTVPALPASPSRPRLGPLTCNPGDMP